MPVHRSPAPARVGISPDTHARVTIAAGMLGVPVSEFVERALKAELARARIQVKVERYNAALREADRTNKLIRPTPAEFGLPADYGMPKS